MSFSEQTGFFISLFRTTFHCSFRSKKTKKSAAFSSPVSEDNLHISALVLLLQPFMLKFAGIFLHRVLHVGVLFGSLSVFSSGKMHVILLFFKVQTFLVLMSKQILFFVQISNILHFNFLNEIMPKRSLFGEALSGFQP